MCTKEQDPAHDTCNMRFCDAGETFENTGRKCRPRKKAKEWWRYFAFLGVVLFFTMGSGAAVVSFLAQLLQLST